MTGRKKRAPAVRAVPTGQYVHHIIENILDRNGNTVEWTQWSVVHCVRARVPICETIVTYACVRSLRRS
jgi:hypothetical protein